MDEAQNSLYVLQERCPHAESVYLIWSWWVYFALISTENVAVLLYVSKTGVPANMVSWGHFYLPPRCNRLHLWAPLGGKLHDEFGQSAFEPIRSVRQRRRRWMISGELALSHPVKTWSGHDCPPSLAWVSHSYITLLAAPHVGFSFTKGPRPSILSRGSSQRHKWLFLAFKWVWWKLKTGWMSKSRVMSVLTPVEVSKLLLFLTLIGWERAWPDDAGPQGNNKRIWWFRTKIHQCLSVLLYNHSELLHVLHLHCWL